MSDHNGSPAHNTPVKISFLENPITVHSGTIKVSINVPAKYSSTILKVSHSRKHIKKQYKIVLYLSVEYTVFLYRWRQQILRWNQNSRLFKRCVWSHMYLLWATGTTCTSQWAAVQWWWAAHSTSKLTSNLTHQNEENLWSIWRMLWVCNWDHFGMRMTGISVLNTLMIVSVGVE